MENIYKVIVYYCVVVLAVEAGQYCGKNRDMEFYCDKGYCCGEFRCCNYYRYYEKWWFWMIWCIVIMLGCTCAYYRKSNFGSYTYLASFFYPSPPIPAPPTTTINDSPNNDTPVCKLPTYDEVIAMPELGPPNDNEGAPPPYIQYADNPSTEGSAQSESIWIEDEQHLNLDTTKSAVN